MQQLQYFGMGLANDVNALWGAPIPALQVMRYATGNGAPYSEVQPLYNIPPEGSKAAQLAMFAGMLVTDGESAAAKGISNSIPGTLARVIPDGVPAASLGRPGAADVFVTAAEDIRGLNAAQM